MSVGHALLGLLEPEPAHGYTLKRAYDEAFGHERPLKFGQVYATLARLTRDGWASEAGTESGEGPDRRLYAITQTGTAELDAWLARPEPPTAPARSALFLKVTLAIVSGRDVTAVLEVQRSEHLARMRELTEAKRDVPPLERLAMEYELVHLDADLRWIAETAARARQIRKELGG